MNERASQGGGPHRWWHPLVLWCPPLLGVCWVLAIEPGPATTPPCPSMKLLQVPCPACGTLRGLHSLGQGEWERAFALQPLLAVLLATIVTLLFARKPFWRSGAVALFGLAAGLPGFLVCCSLCGGRHVSCCISAAWPGRCNTGCSDTGGYHRIPRQPSRRAIADWSTRSAQDQPAPFRRFRG